MSKQAHCLSHILGQRLVSSSAPEPRRKNKPRWEMSDTEKYEQMRRELSADDYEKHGEIDPQWVLDNEPPPGEYD